MQSMLLAELAILVHLEAVGIVLLVLLRVVIPLLALRAGERYLNAHNGTSLLYLRRALLRGKQLPPFAVFRPSGPAFENRA